MITEFEKFNRNWKVGDIVVLIKKMSHYSLVAGKKYKIVDIGHLNTTVKVMDLETQEIFQQYFFKDRFLSVDDWEFYNDTKKYNL